MTGKEEPLTLGEEASLRRAASWMASIDAPMVFVGYGLSIPEANWDDLAGLDLRGKIAVYVNAPAPVNVSGQRQVRTSTRRTNGGRR